MSIASNLCYNVATVRSQVRVYAPSQPLGAAQSESDASQPARWWQPSALCHVIWIRGENWQRRGRGRVLLKLAWNLAHFIQYSSSWPLRLRGCHKSFLEIHFLHFWISLTLLACLESCCINLMINNYWVLWMLWFDEGDPGWVPPRFVFFRHLSTIFTRLVPCNENSFPSTSCLPPLFLVSRLAGVSLLVEGKWLQKEKEVAASEIVFSCSLQQPSFLPAHRRAPISFSRLPLSSWARVSFLLAGLTRLCCLIAVLLLRDASMNRFLLDLLQATFSGEVIQVHSNQIFVVSSEGSSQYRRLLSTVRCSSKCHSRSNQESFYCGTLTLNIHPWHELIMTEGERISPWFE